MFDPRPYLDQLESICDVDHVHEAEKLQLAAGNHEVIERCPLIVSCNDTMRHVQYNWPPGWPRFSRSEIIKDPAKMLVSELTLAYEGALLRDDRTYTIRADYGAVIIPSILGCTYIEQGDEMPWLEHLSSLESIKKMIDTGIPDLRSGLGRIVEETEQYFLATLSSFEKIHQIVHVGAPDTQGPFNLAASIYGSDIFFAVFDTPEIVHSLLQLVTETCIAFIKFHKKNVNEQNGFSYQMGWIVKGGTRIVDDSAINLSGSMYQEFCAPYNLQISQEFEGFFGHFCGRGSQIFPEILAIPGIHALNFGNPEMQDWQFVYKQAIDKHICLLWDDQIPDKDNQIKTGVVQKVFPHSWEQAKQIASSIKRA
jgi:hypothetical protein